MYTFAWSQVALLLILGGIHSVLVLTGLYQDVSPRTPVLRWILAAWLLGAGIAVYLLGPTAVLQAWAERTTTLPEQVGATFILMSIVTAGTFLFAAALEAIIRRSRKRILLSVAPEATALFEILFAADLLAAHAPLPMPPLVKWLAIDAVHVAADAIQSGVSRQVLIPDLVARTTVHQRFTDIACNIRSFEERISIGGVSERKRVEEDLISIGRALMTQNYSDLPVASQEDKVNRQHLVKHAVRARGLRTLKGLAVALIPLAAVKTLSVIPVSLPPETSAVLTTLASVWFLVKVLSLIEPNYRELLTDVKDAQG